MTEQASNPLRNTRDRMQEAAATSGISVPPLLRVRPCRETAQAFNQPEASHQPHYTAPAGTAFPLKYLAPKRALLTPSRQYVYDTMLYTNTFFFLLQSGEKVVCFQNMTIFARVTAFILEMGHVCRAQQRGPNASAQNVLHLCPWAGKLPISTSWELGEKRKKTKWSCVVVPN